MADENRLLKPYDWERPYPLTLKAYDARPPSEKRYVVVLAHNSAKHAWNYLISIWDMINEEMVADLRSAKGLLKEGLNIEKIRNHLSSHETSSRLKRTPVHVTSFYIYARIFIDRSVAIYPTLTSNYNMPMEKRGSLPKQYYWLKNNRSKGNLVYFQILEKHWAELNEKIIRPRNILITHAIGSTEQSRMGGGKTPKIRYEIFSLEDEFFMLELLQKYEDSIVMSISHPKQQAPNTINELIKHSDRVETIEREKLIELKNKMVKELPDIEDAMEHINRFRSDLDNFYADLIEKGVLTPVDLKVG